MRLGWLIAESPTYIVIRAIPSQTPGARSDGAQPRPVPHVKQYMQQSDCPGRSVLLLEDDADLSLVTALLLRTVGFSTHCEDNAAAARRFFDRNLPDLLVTDIGLGD